MTAMGSTSAGMGVAILACQVVDDMIVIETLGGKPGFSVAMLCFLRDVADVYDPGYCFLDLLAPWECSLGYGS